MPCTQWKALTNLCQHRIAGAVMIDWVVCCQADAVAKNHQQHDQLEVRVGADLQQRQRKSEDSLSHMLHNLRCCTAQLRIHMAGAS